MAMSKQSTILKYPSVVGPMTNLVFEIVLKMNYKKVLIKEMQNIRSHHTEKYVSPMD